MRENVVLSTCKSSMHTQHVKFSTYVLVGGGKDVGADAVTDSLPSSSSSSSVGTGDEPAAAAAVVVVVVLVVIVLVVVVVVAAAAAAAVVVVVAVVSFSSIAPSLSPAASSLFESFSFFFLGNDAFFCAAAFAAAFNRLHCRLWPSFQCFI